MERNQLLTHVNRITIIIKLILLALVAFAPATRYHRDKVILILSLLLVVLFVISELLRKKYTEKIIMRIVVLSGSMLVSAIVMVLEKSGSPILIYYFFLLDDIFEIKHKNTRNIFIALHFLYFMVIRILEEMGPDLDFILNLVTSFVFYFFIVVIFWIIHYFKAERDKYKLLYYNLVQYSFQEREYLISEDRSKISQELHDSLGHLLMSALYNIRYIKAIQPQNGESMEAELSKTEQTIKQCVESLRTCVNSVREMEEEINLTEEINRISVQFESLKIVKIQFYTYESMESLPNHTKNIFYKIIREAITNSIIHGNASHIKISLTKFTQENKLLLDIIDDGKGCGCIINSYGLNGIQERVKGMNGQVVYKSSSNKGFEIRIEIPGGKADDQSDDCR
jgi:signal transduction histidine kinase